MNASPFRYYYKVTHCTTRLLPPSLYIWQHSWSPLRVCCSVHRRWRSTFVGNGEPSLHTHTHTHTYKHTHMTIWNKYITNYSLVAKTFVMLDSLWHSNFLFSTPVLSMISKLAEPQLQSSIPEPAVKNWRLGDCLTVLRQEACLNAPENY